jgi:hypothetical protein
MRKFFLFAAVLVASLLLATSGWAQSSLIMPIPEQQFFTPQGAVCSGCFVYTYVSGTNTPQATFTDSTGVTPNTNPVVLNSSGYPQTSIGAQVGIWLSPTATYRIVLKNAANVQIYQVDGITGQLPGTLISPLVIQNGSCNQLTIGLPSTQTGLCFPAPPGNITLTFPNGASDTMVGRATSDSLSNKTLLNPLFNSSNCAIANGPGTYICIANANPAGTAPNFLVKLLNAPSQATVPLTTDTGGVLGICVAGCGNTGTATIQQSGTVSCLFDGTTLAGDYVQISSTGAGNCHDSSTGYPTSGQVIGRVLTSNAGPGTYLLDLFGPEIAAHGILCADGTATTVNANTTSNQVMKVCQLQPGAMNALSKTFRMTTQVSVVPGGAGPPNSLVEIGVGTTSSLGNYAQIINETAAISWEARIQATCTTRTAGATGSLSCTLIVTPVNGSGLAISSANFLISAQDLTGNLWVGTACVFSSGSASNSCVQNSSVTEQLN